MLGYAKVFKDKIRAEGIEIGKAEQSAEIARQLQEVQSGNTTLDDVLKLHNTRNGNSTNTHRHLENDR